MEQRRNLVVQELNDHGSACMSRMLTALQPALGQLGSPSGTFWPGATRHFDRARAYFALLTQPTDSILRAAGSKPGRFSQSEWMALLQVRFVAASSSSCKSTAAIHVWVTAQQSTDAGLPVCLGHASWQVEPPSKLFSCINCIFRIWHCAPNIPMRRIMFACLAASNNLPSRQHQAMQTPRSHVPAPVKQDLQASSSPSSMAML